MNTFDHRKRCFRIRTTYNALFDLIFADIMFIYRRFYFMDLLHPSNRLNFVPVVQQFFCNCSSSYSSYSFTRTRASTSHPVSKTIFLFKSIIRVAGSVQILEVIISMRLCVLIRDHHRNCRACGTSLKNSGKNPSGIAFLTLCRYFALPWTPPVKLVLQIIFTQRKSGRAAVNYYPNSAAMGFTPGSDSK